MRPRPTMVVSIPKEDGREHETPEDQSCPCEALAVEAAVEKYQPVIILASWMAMGRDWTAHFRQCHPCLEYILIGPAIG